MPSCLKTGPQVSSYGNVRKEWLSNPPDPHGQPPRFALRLPVIGATFTEQGVPIQMGKILALDDSPPRTQHPVIPLTDREALEALAVGAMVEEEVVGPHVVALRGWLGARARLGPTSTLLSRHLKFGETPQPIRTIPTHRVTFSLEKIPNPTIPVPGVLGGEGSHALLDRCIPSCQSGCIVQAGTRHREQRARTPLRQPAETRKRDLSAARGRAYHFFA